MYKAKLKQGKRVKDYLQTTALQDIQDRFDCRLLEGEESFAVYCLADLVYQCQSGEIIQVRLPSEAPPGVKGEVCLINGNIGL